MPKVRVPWLVVIAVLLLVAVVPALREQARLQWLTLPLPLPARALPPAGAPIPAEPDPIMDWLQACRLRSVEFVETHCPEDPEMLIAAGTLTGPTDEGVSLLRRAVALDERPVAWAAYVDALLARGPWSDRVGTSGVDPANSKAAAEIERVIAERHLPTSLSPDETAPLLQALANWQQADPENALPVALKAWCLYGLEREAEALSCWQQASSLPLVSTRATARAHFVSRLLTQMGMSAPEATIAASRSLHIPSLDCLGLSAAAVYHEGRRAQMAGRGGEALRLWQATIDLGRHMQDSCDTVAAFTTGVILESIGAAPAWIWCPDSATGIRSPGPLHGRFFYGPHHSLFVSELGEAADIELVKRLVQARTRARMIQHFLTLAPTAQVYSSAAEMLLFGQLVGGLLAATFLLFLLLGSSARKQADAATNLGPVYQFLVCVPVLLVSAVAAGILLAVAPRFPISPLLAPSLRQLSVAIGASLLATLLFPLAAATLSRQPSASLLAAWRGSLRRVLPITLALGAVLYLALGLAAMHLRARWLQEWSSPGVTERQRVIRWFGPRWDNPRIPPDSYRAEYPPESR